MCCFQIDQNKELEQLFGDRQTILKANQLKVMLSDQGKYFVESSKGKILYNVVFDGDVHGCTCGDYARNAKKDPEFKCKHILAVENSVTDEDMARWQECSCRPQDALLCPSCLEYNRRKYGDDIPYGGE